MRILFILTRGDAVGGASIHVRDMARRLIDDGHQALILVGQGQEVPDALQAAEVPYCQINSMDRSVHPWNDLKALVKILAEIRQFKPDIVSCHTAKAGALGRVAARLTRVRSIYSPHCWSFVDDFPKAKLYLWLERVLAFTTDRLVAVSHYEREQGIAAGACKESNSLTIHNGMPDLEAPRAEPDRSPPTLMMVARFDTQKDHSTLIRALHHLLGLEWQLQLIGDGPLKAAIEKEVAELGMRERVQFVGYSNAVHQQLQAVQIFVLSTHWESFPRSILEAMRAGLPIVASDIGGCCESVQSGSNGFIVEPSNAEALSEKLKQLIESPDLRRTMGASSRQHYESQFTFERMFEDYKHLYAQLTNSK